MAQLTRPDLTSQINLEDADINSKLTSNITTNGVGGITGAILNSTLQDIRSSLTDLMNIVRDSHFNLLSDTTDVITEGTDPNKWFFSLTHFIFRLENEASTDNLNEGTTNLYYTEPRVDARIDTLRPTQSGVADPTGSDSVTIIEDGGTATTINLIDTQARTAINQIIDRLEASNILS